MHNCFNEMNSALEKHNGRLATAFGITQDMGIVTRYLVSTEKIDKAKRKPVPSVMCSHCPFCGEKLRDESEGEGR